LDKALKEKDVKLEDMEEDRFCIADNIINNDIYIYEDLVAIIWEKLTHVIFLKRNKLYNIIYFFILGSEL
jgi:hypothetical protein